MDGGSRMASMATSLYKYSTRLTGRHRAFVAGASRGAPIPLSANTSGLSVNGVGAGGEEFEETEVAEDLELLADLAAQPKIAVPLKRLPS